MSAITAIVIAQLAAGQPVQPVLAFPEPGLEDSAAYQGYRTRFLRDAAGNTVQVYINQGAGRLVHLWADAANASAAFTVRAGGTPVALDWDGAEARVWSEGGSRYVEYRVRAREARLEIGRILLGSMRLERDFQYFRKHLEPFGAPDIEQPELTELLTLVERLEPAERRRHLELLRAGSTGELRDRLRPAFRQGGTRAHPALLVEQQTFDGRNRLSLQLTFENADLTVDTLGRMASVRARAGAPVRIVVRAGTDAPALTPLRPDEIFNADFLRFHDETRRAAASDAAAAARFRRLDRQLRSIELVSSEEKLMAGLPNYATYFGRDMIMSALMLEPIWSPAMVEHVIASVLRKLKENGEVSHEEALGGQAIRENAAEYNALVRTALDAAASGDRPRADSALARARETLADLQAVRENYHMVDDDFQFPILVARYLANPGVPAERKRAFLLAADGTGTTRLARLLRNLAFVASETEAYARAPIATNLVSFRARPDGTWSPGSWRDSGAGYAGGRFAMDVNVVWAPHALAALDEILTALRGLGLETDAQALDATLPGADAVRRYAADRSQLEAAIETWRGARRHFEVELAPGEARRRVDAWLATLPVEERTFWSSRVVTPSEPVRFLAVALDSHGQPIPVMNTDPATELFLEEPARATVVLRDMQSAFLPFPLGLHEPALGPLVANDVYASPEVQARFREDLYHSPRVVWGREVNLLLLALARHIAASPAAGGADVRSLAHVLRLVHDAVEASGLKHNELWSYEIQGGRLVPIRYGASTDIQLWNLTDLAVQYALSRLPAHTLH